MQEITDEELLAGLARVGSILDPMDDEVLDSGSSALRLRPPPGAELVEISYDSSLVVPVVYEEVDALDSSPPRIEVLLQRFEEVGASFDPGTRVMTGDHEGNRCEGRVVGRHGEWVQVALDLPTFRGSGT